MTKNKKTPTVDQNNQAAEAAENAEKAEQVDETQDASAETEETETAPPEDIANVKTDAAEDIVKLRAESEKNLQGWQRTLAEFQNYKRRIEREQQTVQQKAALDVITRLLPIIDDFERAMANIPVDFQEHPWLGGITMIQGKFMRLLEEFEVQPVDPQGELFDPNQHQAITMDDSDEVESGHVIETLQKGYVSGDVLLRPALVRVAN
ncbi:MAG: nucleotide exchange factor GrpE [Chloroflexota bacterium]